MRKFIAISFIFMVLFLVSCKDKEQNLSESYTAEPANEEKISFTRENYPKFDGSTATIPLSEAYAQRLLGLKEDELDNFVKHNKTHTAYENLIKGYADIIFVTEPSEDELKIAKDANVELEVVPVVKEGFVFMVNKNNPVENLTSKQIQDIYQGKIKNWKEVGGEDCEIIAYQRNKNSGSQTMMEQGVMKGIKMSEEPKTVVTTMSDLIETVASYETSEKALGYSFYYYAKTMYKKDNIKLLAIDNIRPDNKSIADGNYPFETAYFAVIRKSETLDSQARKLLKWVLGEEGQKVSENAGYVPLEVR